MADELDHLQVQEDLLTRLHIQAARQQLIRGGESLSECECCGNDIPSDASKRYPGYGPARNVSGYWSTGANTTRGERWKTEQAM